MNNAVPTCLRRLFVWLLLLAIPFQGIAAAGMVACAHGTSGQHSSTLPATLSVTAPVTAAQHAYAAAGPCHDAVEPAREHMAASHDQPTSGHGHDRSPDPSYDREHNHDDRCSACAACCIGAAMAGAPAVPAAPQTLSARLISAATGRLATVDLAQPDRPPRFPLA